ncbi:MAG: hypothetical protein EB075_05030 [Bacteroidetes bacterium]|nr:hypothetical protein [Bacteroidota bacterium]
MPATTTAAAASRATDAADRAISGLMATNPAAAARLEHDLAQIGEGRQIQVTRKGELVSFVSYLSDAEAIAALAGMRSSFAQDLYRSRNRLSERQLAWAHKLASDAQQPRQQASEAAAGPSPFEALFGAFEAARAKGAKRLTLRFAGVNVKPNRDVSALWVTSQTETEMGDYGPKPKYLGKVTRSGLDSRLSDDVKAVLNEAAKDPLTVAIRYGKESGECSCCGRELTDPQSIERGIGPICATKYGW